MKLQFQSDLKPQRLSLSIPGDTYQDLQLFQRYLREELGQQRDLKQIATTVIETFLKTGDRQFLAWKAGLKNGKKGAGARTVERGEASLIEMDEKGHHA
jgi:hypothetical protein